MTRARLSGILPFPESRVTLPAVSPNESNDTLSWLQLTLLPGLTPATQRKLLRAFGTPAQVLATPRGVLGQHVGAQDADRIAKGANEALVERALRWLEDPNHHLLTLGDPAYPRGWLELSDPPSAVYAIGRVELLNAPSLAIVGSRNSTPQGTRDAYAFAQALSAAGLCIVSGLALGIDAQAHRGGLEGTGASVAVMGTGADRVYPRRNVEVAQQLAQRGCLVTEFALGVPPEAANFPRRNRLISGLARGVLVVEAAEKSGSLITARFAAEQGRDVFALPGSIHSPLAKGCHILIKEGAKLVESAHDVLVELGLAQPAPAAAPATEDADPFLRAMGFSPVTVDQLAQLTGGEASGVSARLTRLQIEGRVSALAGGWFQRVG